MKNILLETNSIRNQRENPRGIPMRGRTRTATQDIPITILTSLSNTVGIEKEKEDKGT